MNKNDEIIVDFEIINNLRSAQTKCSSEQYDKLLDKYNIPKVM